MNLDLTITEEIMWDFDENKKIGHVRCQFGNYDIIANQFVTNKNTNALLVGENSHEIDMVVNYLQFDFIKDYNNIVDNLTESEGLGNEKDYFAQYGNLNYWVRVLPVGTSEYNAYIYIFKK